MTSAIRIVCLVMAVLAGLTVGVSRGQSEGPQICSCTRINNWTLTNYSCVNNGNSLSLTASENCSGGVGCLLTATVTISGQCTSGQVSGTLYVETMTGGVKYNTSTYGIADMSSIPQTNLNTSSSGSSWNCVPASTCFLIAELWQGTRPSGTKHLDAYSLWGCQ